jgi:PKD repeat protein
LPSLIAGQTRSVRSISCTPPAAAFAVTSNGLEATFTDLSVDADDWSWDFGDGSSSSAYNPVHTYPAGGTYLVCLTVSNVCRDTSFCDTVTVVPGCDLGVALVGEDPTCNLPNGAVEASVSGGTFPYAFSWSNGQTSRTITHVSAGTYHVTVSDVAGCEVRDSVTIQSATLPAVIDLGEAISFCGGGFLDAGTSTGIQFLWQDGSTNPVFQVQQSGTYWVEVVNAEGCVSRDSVAVRIDASPLAGFAYQAQGLEVSFFNASNQGAIYHWDLGDGNTSDQFQPVHTYAVSGNYLVTHIVTNACGSDTIANTVNVSLTAVEEGMAAGKVSVFPNPNSGQFVLQLNEAGGEEVSWAITDLQGRIVLESTQTLRNQAHQEVIDLTTQPTGMYLLRVQVGRKHAIQKITVIR